MNFSHDEIKKILRQIRPGAAYNINDGVIQWTDEQHDEPSDAEMQAGMAELERLAYREKRAAEYPAIGDQLDALWKGGDAAAEMLTRVQAVKNKYPKSE